MRLIKFRAKPIHKEAIKEIQQKIDNVIQSINVAECNDKEDKGE